MKTDKSDGIVDYDLLERAIHYAFLLYSFNFLYQDNVEYD